MAALAGVGPLLGTAACARSQDPTNFSALELTEALSQGKLTALGLVRACLDKIDRLDGRLNSVIEINPEALALARAWDSAPTKGPLAGLPILLKDNIATGDRMVTSAGSAALAESRYPVDSEVARRLRGAGAILLGKTNMSEWANYRSTNSSGGWSARGGQCRNPYALDRTPSGSSSGSAAAVAAGFCALAVGTETVGSIVSPAAMCGIVGFKPTAGLVPGDGIIPIATSWDTAGPMARSVGEVALLASVLMADPKLAVGGESRLEGARLGVARQYFGFDARVDAVVERELQELSRLGAIIVDPVRIPGWFQFGPAAEQVMAYEFKAGVNAYLAAQSPQVKIRSLVQVLEYNIAHPEIEGMDFMGQELLIAAEEKGDLREPLYLKALAEVRSLARDALGRIFEENNLDAIVAPTNGPAWLIDRVNGDHYKGGCAAPPAVGGLPHVTVPAGQVHQLPVGLSFFGRQGTDGPLLSLAHQYETATAHRRSPQFLSTLRLP